MTEYERGVKAGHRDYEHAARAMLKALKNLRRTLASQGGIVSGFWRDADAAIKLAEDAGITTGETDD